MRETDARPIRLKPDSAPALFASHSAHSEPTLFAGTSDEPRRRGGLSVWFAAAGSLVLGIVIGFASGYRVGQGLPGVTTAEPVATPTPTGGSGQPFSESAVAEPVRIEPDPVVPAPETPPGPQRGPETPASPQRRPQAAAEPALQGQRPAVGRVPARSGAPAADAASAPPPPTGPGSLQVLSRPAGAQVFLDGKAVGRTPLLISEVGAGQHNVRLELPGFNRWATTVDVQAGGPIRVAASLEQ